MQIVAVVELPSERRRERASNRRLAGACDSHNDQDHCIASHLTSPREWVQRFLDS
jgi:hypothetical protein